MKRPLRHLVLILGGLGLLLLLFFVPRDADLPSTPARPADPVAVVEPLPVVEAAPGAASNPALYKKAEQAFSRSRTPITAATAPGSGPARFVVRDRNVNAFFTPQGVTLSLLGKMNGKRPDPMQPGWGLHWGIAGAAPVEPRPEGEQATKVHVLKGKPEEWKADQKTYARVVYEDVKPGVAMIVESAPHGLKYSLLAGKASDVAALRLRYQGAAALRAVEDGKALEISTGQGHIREDGLIVTQEGRPIEASYQVTGQDEYAIVLHGADPAKPLEVDPVIGWSTYLGGTLGLGGGSDYGYCIKVDGGGNMYLGGYTYSAEPSFTTAGAYDRTIGGNQDGFIAKVNASGTLAWLTYLGGSSYDRVAGLAIEGGANPNVYVTGLTESNDFPVTAGVVDTNYENAEAFVAKISNSGASLVWATFLGGNNYEVGQCIAVNSAGSNVWVAGYTYSNDFPTFLPFDSTLGSGGTEGFVTKLNSNATAFVWSSFVGGSSDDIINGMVVNAAGEAYLTGYTYSNDFPLAGSPYRNFNSGNGDIFVAKVKPAATAFEWATYIGGSDFDVANDIALDTTGNVFITGSTNSMDYPTPQGYYTSNFGSSDAFLTKLNPSGSNLVFSSYLGGPDYDVGRAVVVDSAGRGIIAGFSYSSAGFPIGNIPGEPSPYDNTQNGSGDIFVSGWTNTLSPGPPPFVSLAWSTWLGGAGFDAPASMAIDASNRLYLTGETSSSPTIAPGAFPLSSAPNPLPFDSTLNSDDAFVIRLTTSLPAVALTYGSYLGGANAVGDDYGRKVAVDANGYLFVTGVSYSSDFPTPGGGQGFNAGSADVTVTKYSNAASPTILWSTYLGGSNYEEPAGIGLDPTTAGVDKEIYVVGRSFSFDFPTTFGPLLTGSSDIFVTKLTIDGNSLRWSRFFGGSSTDYANGIAVNSSGEVAIVGFTFSNDLPTTAGAYQSFPNSFLDAFLAKVRSDGALQWLTYFGGSNDDFANGVAFDSSGTLVHVAGSTSSSDLPTLNAYQPFPGGGFSSDMFLARFNPSVSFGAQLQLSTYLGGPDYETGVSVDVDASGIMYLLGSSGNGTFFTTTGPAWAGSDDAVIAKFRDDGALYWSRYLGGSNTEGPSQIRVDAFESVYVTGYTYSIDFPVQGASGAQASLAGNADVFVSKIDSNGSTLDWSMYLGGSNYDFPYGLALGSGATVYVVGETFSPDFPRLGAPDNTHEGSEMFVTRIDNSNPSIPSTLQQFKANGSTGLGVGAWSNETTFVAKGTLGDLDDDPVALEVEIKPIDVAFNGAVSATGALGITNPRSVVVTFPALPATQQFHWRARALDSNGRTSNWLVFGGNLDTPLPAARDLGRDITAPTLAMSTPTTGSTYTTSSALISFTGTNSNDGLSPILSITWSNVIPSPPSTFSSGSATLNTATTWSIPSIALSPGTNTVTMTATDQAGNASIPPLVVTVTYDTAAPTTTIMTPVNSPPPPPPPPVYLTGTGSPPGGPASGFITLGGTATDAFEVASVGWTNSAGGNGFALLSPAPPLNNRTWTADITLSPGNNVITVTTLDGANNSHADQITVNYDNVAPAVNITTIPFTTDQPTANLAGTATDANGISSVTWVSNRGPSGTASLLPSPWSISGIPLSPGANIITVTANDGVVNARSTLNSASTAITILQDAAAPVTTIVNPAPTLVMPYFSTGNPVITISGTATDDLNVVGVAWINPAAGVNTPQPAAISGPITSRTWSADVSLTGGDNTITFTATDGVGRTHSAQTIITLSTTAPTLTVTNPATTTAVVATSPISVTATASFAAPATSIVSVTATNLTTAVMVPAVNTPPWTASVNLVIGSNTVEVRATDNLGLFTTETRTIILDPTAPSVTITGPTGADTLATSGNTVTLSGVASDNRGIASVTWSNPPTLNQPVTPLVGPPTSVTWTTSAIPLNLGANVITIRATDEAGNTSTDTITVTTDTTTPGITITAPTSAPVVTVTAASGFLSGTASDNVGLQTITWLNAATGVSGSLPGASPWTTPSINLNLGANPITVIAVDNAGNTQTDSILVFRDGAPPALTITSPTADPTLSTATATISLGGTASDDVQVAQISWTITPGGQAGTTSPGTTWSIASIPLAAGNNTITVTATDGANTSANDVIIVSYDPTIPTVTIDFLNSLPATNPFSTTTTPLNMAGSAGDNIAVTGVTWTNLTTGGSGSASGSTTWNCLVPLTSGDNLITAKAVDAAGNSFSTSLTVVYDPAAPIIDITTPTTALSIVTNSTPILIGGTASDDVGVATISWTTSGAVAITSGSQPATDPWSFSVQLAPGENVITVTATDGVGRTGTSFLTIIYDPTPPQVTVTVPTTDPTFLTTQSTLTVAGIANDNLNLQSVTWSNAATTAGGNTQGAGAWSIPAMALNEGPNLVTVTATDSVNNSGSSAITIIYDGTNPTVTITPPLPPDVMAPGPPYTTNVRPFPIAGTAADNLGLAGVSWTNDRGGGGPANLVLGNWDASVYLLTGVNIITVTATDDHGRTAAATLTVTFTPEGTAPTISFTTPATTPFASPTQVISAAGVSNDNVGVVSVTWRNVTTFTSGDVVPVAPLDFSSWTADIPLAEGSNVLVATAVDDAGNIASATVTVTYAPVTPDTTDPAILITLPSNTGAYTASTSPVALSATTIDAGGVAAVRWTNAGTGGDGFLSPIATDTWTDSIALALGTNVIVLTAIDAAGNTATDTIVVTFTPAAPDGISPTVSIVNPPTGVTFNTAVGTVTLSGTSSDDTAVATVVWLNGASSSSGSADGTTAWTVDIPLLPGINLITMRVFDTSGNTDTDTLTVLYTPPPPPPEVVPAGSCGLVGLDALALLALLAAWRRRRTS